jgi:hypothetical protein
MVILASSLKSKNGISHLVPIWTLPSQSAFLLPFAGSSSRPRWRPPAQPLSRRPRTWRAASTGCVYWTRRPDPRCGHLSHSEISAEKWNTDSIPVARRHAPTKFARPLILSLSPNHFERVSWDDSPSLAPRPAKASWPPVLPGVSSIDTRVGTRVVAQQAPQHQGIPGRWRMSSGRPPPWTRPFQPQQAS